MKGKILLAKAKNSMLSAVTIYNNPLIKFRSEIYIINAIISWTYLFHAYFKNNDICYFYLKKDSNKKTKYVLIDGRRKEWDLKECISQPNSPIDSATKKNLELLIKVRNEIEHCGTNVAEDFLDSYIQACSINFNFYIKNLFGEKYGLDDMLNVSIQFSKLNPNQIDILKSMKVQNNISKIISKYEDELSQDILNNGHYSYKVIFVGKNANKEGQADTVLNFTKVNSSNQKDARQVLVKETEKEKYLPTRIVKELMKAGFSWMNITIHTKLWKKFDAKNPKKNFGIEVEGKWYWYETWLTFLKDYLSKHSGDEFFIK